MIIHSPPLVNRSDRPDRPLATFEKSSLLEFPIPRVVSGRVWAIDLLENRGYMRPIATNKKILFEIEGVYFIRNGEFKSESHHGYIYPHKVPHSGCISQGIFENNC
jgi:hypothetical protein